MRARAIADAVATVLKAQRLSADSTLVVAEDLRSVCHLINLWVTEALAVPVAGQPKQHWPRLPLLETVATLATQVTRAAKWRSLLTAMQPRDAAHLVEAAQLGDVDDAAAAQATATPVGVVTHAITRWSSAFSALKRALPLRPALAQLARTERDSLPQLSDGDWSALEQLLMLLQPFAAATAELRRDPHRAVARAWRWLVCLRRACQHPLTEQFCDAVKVVRDSLLRSLREEDELKVDDVVRAVTLADPTEKVRVSVCMGVRACACVGVCSETRTLRNVPDIVWCARLQSLWWLTAPEDAAETARAWAALSAVIERNERRIAQGKAPPEVHAAVSACTAAGAAGAGAGAGADVAGGAEEEEEQYVDLGPLAARPPKRPKHAAAVPTVAEEVEAYRRSLPPGAGVSILVWWSTNEALFPRVARWARVALATPASAAPPERVFARMNVAVERQTDRLEPDRVRRRIFTRHNLPLLLPAEGNGTQ